MMKRRTIYQPDLMTIEMEVRGRVQGIQQLQGEINQISKRLDIAVNAAKKQSLPKGEIVAFDKLYAARPIAEELSQKQNEYKLAVDQLNSLIFTGDVFIDQHYWDCWIQIGPDLAIRFGDGLERLDVKSVDELINSE